MRTPRKLLVLVLLGSTAMLGACSMVPKEPVESTMGQSKLDPSIRTERLTLADRQGVSTLKIVQQNGVTVKADWVDETSTSEQDMANIVAGAATGPFVNNTLGAAREAAAHRRCQEDGCGSSGSNTVVNTVVETASNAVADSAARGSGPCGRERCLDQGAIK